MLWVLLTGPIVGRAQPGGDAELKAWVDAQLSEAYAHHQAGRYAEAIAGYRRVHARSPEPRFLLNIGIAYAEMGGQCVQMVDAFQRFERACSACAEKEQGLRRWEALRPRCVAKVMVTSEPPGAVVEVDGERLGAAPQQTQLLAGEHVVMARLEGHAPHQQTVRIEDAEARTLTLALKPAAPPEAKAPSAPEPPPAVAAASGSAMTAGGGSDVWAWTAVGVGVVGVAVGVTFTALAFQAADDAEQATRRVDAADAIDRRDQATTLQWIGYGVGVAGLATAATLWWLDAGDEPVAWRPFVGPAGLGLSARF